MHTMLPVVGRTLIGALFLVAGVRKLVLFAASAAYFGRLGIPAPEAMTWVVIAVEVVGGLALIVGWQARLAAWILAVFVVVATGVAHRFWEFDQTQFANQMNHFLKNLAVIGGLLMVVAFGPGRACVGKT